MGINNERNENINKILYKPTWSSRQKRSRLLVSILVYSAIGFLLFCLICAIFGIKGLWDYLPVVNRTILILLWIALLLSIILAIVLKISMRTFIIYERGITSTTRSFQEIIQRREEIIPFDNIIKISRKEKDPNRAFHGGYEWVVIIEFLDNLKKERRMKITPVDAENPDLIYSLINDKIKNRHD